MQFFTVGKGVAEIGRVAKISCFSGGLPSYIDIKGECFLLIVLLGGRLCLKRGNQEISAAAPSFICFNEGENIELLSEYKAEYHSVFFHPEFLNINMSFELLRSGGYGDIAGVHDMFMLKPFLDNCFTIPIRPELGGRLEEICRSVRAELENQRDWYWSCRGRSYFMELIILLERMYGLMGYGETDKAMDISFGISDSKLQAAILFIETHYMQSILISDISNAAGISTNELGRLFKVYFGVTVKEYLYSYRVQLAKKQLEFTNIPIKDISKRVGFKTVQHFGRVFADKMGMPPARFRKEAVEKRKNHFG